MKVIGTICLCIVLLLAACSRQQEPFSESDRIAVRFSLSGIQAEVSTRADGNSTSPLAEGTTLRILAFKRVGANADLSQDEYIGEGMYKVSGDALMPDSPLVLLAGTYDFYTITPSLEVDKTSAPYTVSVNHKIDYASSLTGQVTVSENDSSVQLEALIRHCTKLNFVISPKESSGITSLTITEVSLSNMTDVPIKGELNKDLPVETANCATALTLSGGEFTATTEKPLDYSASTIVLPRKAGAFSFQMKASVESPDWTGAKVYSAPLPNDLAFQSGCEYTFTVKMKGNKEELVLSVQQWGNNSLDVGGIGGFYTATLTVISEWKDVIWEDKDGLGKPN